jgi:hypothetical protein
VSYDDLIELARLCLTRAAATTSPPAAAELWRLATEYQARAAALGGGRLPDIAAAHGSAAQAAPALQQQRPQPRSDKPDVPVDEPAWPVQRVNKAGCRRVLAGLEGWHGYSHRTEASVPAHPT